MMDIRIIVDKLQKEYQQNGYITENNILDEVVKYNLPFHLIDNVCNQLMLIGVLISDNHKSIENDLEIIDYSQKDYEVVFSKAVQLCPEMNDIVTYIKSIMPPQRNEVETLMPQCRSGNVHARERLILMYLRMALSISLQYVNKTTLGLDDLFQEAVIGLMTAVDKYDNSLHGSFSSYASAWIRQNIDRSMVDNYGLIRVPVHFYEGEVKRVLEIKESLEAAGIYSFSKLVNSSELSSDKVKIILDITSDFVSVEEIIDDESNSEIYLFAECDVEKTTEENITKEIVHNALDVLPERHKEIIEMRYGINRDSEMTLEQIGQVLNVTRERVRQIENKTMRELMRSKELKNLVRLL